MVRKLTKRILFFKGSGITLTNNKIKDIIKGISSLENTEILLKEDFSIFLRVLMIAGIPLMKNVLTALAKSILVPLGLAAVVSTTDAAIQNKIVQFWNNTSIFKWSNRWCRKNGYVPLGVCCFGKRF